MRPQEYLLALLRNWLVIVVTVIIGLAAGFGVSLSMTKQYGSSAQVLFTGHATTNGQDLAYVGSYTQTRLITYQRLAESTSVLNQVRHDLKNTSTVEELRSRIEVSLVQSTSILTIRATGKTPADAVATAGAVAVRLSSWVQALENGQSRKSRATVNAAIIGKPVPSAKPVSPKLPLNLLIGALAGLAVSVGVVTVREAVRAGSRGGAEPE